MPMKKNVIEKFVSAKAIKTVNTALKLAWIPMRRQMRFQSAHFAF